VNYPPAATDEIPFWVWIIVAVGVLLIVGGIIAAVFLIKRKKGYVSAMEIPSDSSRKSVKLNNIKKKDIQWVNE